MQIQVRDSGDLKRVNRQLRQHADGKQLRKELSTGMREVLNPLVPVVRAAYLAHPGYKGRRSRERAQQPPLRALLARSVRVEIKTTGRLAGARIRADGRRMPSGMKSLPRYWEGEGRNASDARWRWPVFPDAGARHRFTDRTRTQATEASWVQGRARPTFYQTVVPHADEAGRRIDEVLQETKRKLERGR